MKPRIKNDFYPTEEQVTKALLKVRPDLLEGDIFECCAGKGHISDLLRNQSRFPVDTGDITYKPWSFDATSRGNWHDLYLSPDWVITNPPFNVAEEILPLAFNKASKGMAMLLRLSYLEPTKGRSTFLQENPLSNLIVLNPRPRFRSDTNGSDSVTTAWFVWDKEPRPTKITYCNDWKTL